MATAELSEAQLQRIEANRQAAIRRQCKTTMTMDVKEETIPSRIGTPLKQTTLSDMKKNASGWRRPRKRKFDSVIEGNTKANEGTDFSEKDDALSGVVDALAHKQSPTIKSLSTDQLAVLQAVSRRESVFLTGCAGTGKTYILEFAIRQLRAMYGADCVHVTASTGLAACNIGGSTLHSFAGVGLGVGPQEELLQKVMSRKETRQRWQNAKALVIDEISMVDGRFFDTLEFIARRSRRSSRPFGGIQLLVTGDFYQLPPVNDSKGTSVNSVTSGRCYAFEAESWHECFNKQVVLQQVFRQADDTFVRLLNEVREGNVSEASLEKLRQRQVGARGSDEILATAEKDNVLLTTLYPYKADVARENQVHLARLPGEQLLFSAKDEAESDFARRQLEFTRAEKELQLKVGAQVMLLKNLDTASGLVNGARGVIISFSSPSHPDGVPFRHLASALGTSGRWPIVRFACSPSSPVLLGPQPFSVEDSSGRATAKRQQVPLALAWALSVHKCQGMTLDRVQTDLARAFDCGMVYVALSRVRALEGLLLTGFDASRIKVDPKVVHFYKQLQRGEE